MFKFLPLLLLLYAGAGYAAISGTADQVAGDHFGAVTTETISSADGWSATPTSGDLLIGWLCTRNDTGTITWPTGFVEVVSYTAGTTDVNGAIAWKVSAGTETSLVVSWANTVASGSIAFMEIPITDLDSSGIDASGEDETNVGTSVQSQSSGSATNTTANALAIALQCRFEPSAWSPTTVSNSFVEQLEFPDNESRAGGVFATKVLSSTGSQTTTFATADTGEKSYGAIIIFAEGNAASFNDTTIAFGQSITITASGLSGNITQVTTPGGDVISVDGGASSTSATFTSCAVSDLVSGGACNNTRIGQSGTWVVTDGSTNINVTSVTINDPDGTTIDGDDHFFVQLRADFASLDGDTLAPSGAEQNDDFWCRETSAETVDTLDTDGVAVLNQNSDTADMDCQLFDLTSTAVWGAVVQFNLVSSIAQGCTNKLVGGRSFVGEFTRKLSCAFVNE